MIGAYAYTLIHPPLSLEALTPLERLILGEVMESRVLKKCLHLYAYDDLSLTFDLFLHDAVVALEASKDQDSVLNTLVTGLIDAASAYDDSISLNLGEGDVSFEHILQDIVRRSPTLTHLVVTSGYARSGLEAGAAGGSVTVITTGDIQQKCTTEIIDEFLDDAGLLTDGVLKSRETVCE